MPKASMEGEWGGVKWLKMGFAFWYILSLKKNKSGEVVMTNLITFSHWPQAPRWLRQWYRTMVQLYNYCADDAQQSASTLNADYGNWSVVPSPLLHIPSPPLYFPHLLTAFPFIPCSPLPTLLSFPFPSPSKWAALNSVWESWGALGVN